MNLQMSDSRSIVITGSSRGIGYGLAESFLTLGCRVTVSGRRSESVEEARATLAARHGSERVFGFPCDVREHTQVQALWDAAQSHFGRIDVWINNAGVGHAQTAFWDQPAQEMQEVVDANLVGAMYGGKVALGGMMAQGFGSLYNMEGLGSDGRRVEGLTLYGSTKSALRYLTDAWAQETKGTGVIVGALSPGMVATRFITDRYKDRPEEWEKAKRVLSILSDRVETVTPWLARKVLANRKNGVRFNWLSTGKLMGRFLSAPFRKRDPFQEVP